MPFLSSEDPMTTELRDLDRRRDVLRAMMEDRDLEKLALSDYDARMVGIHPDHAKARWAKRQSRRAWEIKMGIHPIPPGPWSQDLDNYHDAAGYTFDFGDGYTGRLTRTRCGTFNGYVTLPRGHPCAGLMYHIFETYHDRVIPYPPRELNFSDGIEFGFDHCSDYDVKPVTVHTYSAQNYYSASAPLVGSGYVTYSDALEEVKAVHTYFKMLEADHWEAINAWRTDTGRPNHDHAAMMERRRLLTATVSSVPPAIGAKRSWAAVVKNQ